MRSYFKKSIFLVFVIVLLGFAIRLYKLTSSPEGLYIDETSIAYNAYSIISTGRDEHGTFMPLFFEAFGEYKLPIYIYLVALTQIIIGVSDLAVRIPSLLFGTFSIFLIYLFTRELIGDYKISILSSFLLAVSPWHYQFSRPGFEASVGLFFLILALYLFFRGLNKNSSRYIGFSFISFVITLYSYNSARIVTPVTALILFILYFRHFEIRNWIKIGLIAFILAIPFLNFSFSREGLVRARQVSIFFQKDTSPLHFFSNYYKNISPFYLFKNGDPTFNHLTPYRMSLIHTVEAPFFFMGLIYSVWMKSKKLLFLVSLFFISLIPPSVASLNPHALRGMLALSSTPIISAVGFGCFLSLFKRKYLRLIMVIIFMSMVLISTLLFLDRYHNQYIPSSGWDWQVGIKRAGARVLAIENNYNDIYLDLDQRIIASLWYFKIDPGLYQKGLTGKYHINEPISSEHGLYVGLAPQRGRLLEYVYYPNNTVAYGMWEF